MPVASEVCLDRHGRCDSNNMRVCNQPSQNFFAIVVRLVETEGQIHASTRRTMMPGIFATSISIPVTCDITSTSTSHCCITSTSNSTGTSTANNFTITVVHNHCAQRTQAHNDTKSRLLGWVSSVGCMNSAPRAS